MAKYIETDKLKQMVEHKMDMQDTYLPAHFFDIVDDMPAADVQKIVRCGECTYRKLCEEVTFEYKGKNGYCSKGEKE